MEIIPGLYKYASPDFPSVVVREISKNTNKDSLLITHERNVAYTAHVIWAIFFSLLTLASLFFFRSTELRIGILIGSVTLFLGFIGRMYLTNCRLVKNFKIFARGELIRGLIGAVFTVSTIWLLGLYAPLLGLLAGTFAMIIYLHRAVGLKFTPELQKLEFHRQLTIAIPLSMGTLAVGFEIWVERITIATFWGADNLGNYMLLVVFLNAGQMLITSFLQAVNVHLYQRYDDQCSDLNKDRILHIPTLTFACIIPLFSVMIVIWGGSIISLVLPEYVTVIQYLPYLGVNLWLVALPVMYQSVMHTTKLNKQILAMFIRYFVILIFLLICTYTRIVDISIEGAFIARTVSFFLLAFLPILICLRIICPDAVTRKLTEYFGPGIWAFISGVSLIQLDILANLNPALKSLLFIFSYLPFLIYWEFNTQLIKGFLYPLAISKNI